MNHIIFIMKPFILLLLVLSPLLLKAQTDLIYNKRFVESENKWVAFQRSAKDSTYQYGFIYIDSQAGLTLNLEGTFKINNNDIFAIVHNVNRDEKTNIKMRLQPNQIKVAWIPSSHFAELQISTMPDWMKYYRTDTTSAAHFFRWGFLYNDYGESEKALTYLEPAQKIDPDFKGLAFELAFAYNALGKFDKALPILENNIKKDPADCNSYQDLAYTQIHLDDIDKAIETYDTASKNCTKQSTKCEIAFNIAGHYYKLKVKDKFDHWAAEARKWVTPNDKYAANLNKMETELAHNLPDGTYH